jgi:hypothetical protein
VAMLPTMLGSSRIGRGPAGGWKRQLGGST